MQRYVFFAGRLRFYVSPVVSLNGPLSRHSKLCALEVRFDSGQPKSCAYLLKNISLHCFFYTRRIHHTANLPLAIILLIPCYIIAIIHPHASNTSPYGYNSLEFLLYYSHNLVCNIQSSPLWL